MITVAFLSVIMTNATIVVEIYLSLIFRVMNRNKSARHCLCPSSLASNPKWRLREKSVLRDIPGNFGRIPAVDWNAYLGKWDTISGKTPQGERSRRRGWLKESKDHWWRLRLSLLDLVTIWLSMREIDWLTHQAIVIFVVFQRWKFDSSLSVTEQLKDYRTDWPPLWLSEKRN